MFHLSWDLVWQFVHIVILLFVFHLLFNVPSVHRWNESFLSCTLNIARYLTKRDITIVIIYLERIALVFIIAFFFSSMMHFKILLMHSLVFVLVDVALFWIPEKSSKMTICSHIGLRGFIVLAVLLSNYLAESNQTIQLSQSKQPHCEVIFSVYNLAICNIKSSILLRQ